MRQGGLAFAIAVFGATALAGQEVSLGLRAVDARNGQPLAGVMVRLDGPDTTRGRTDSTGAFRTRVRPGAYVLGVTRVGYEPSRISLGIARDTVVTVALRTLGILLDTVRVYGQARVIHGVVATRDMVPLRGVRLEVMGTKAVATTDSSGQFVLGTTDAESYLLRVARDGYSTRLISVSLHKERSVELSIMLDSTARRTHEDVMLDEFQRRVEWRGNRSALVTRAQLQPNEDAPLSEALRRSPALVRKNMPLNGTACVYVNGLARPEWPLDAFDAKDIEAIEVYDRRSELTGTLAQSWPAGARCSDIRDRSDVRPATVGGRRPSDLYIVIWTRSP